MLFNSFEFLLLFLPVTLIGFYALARIGSLWVVLAWLIACSLFFHGYWKASYTWLFVVSIVVNYFMGLACLPSQSRGPRHSRTWVLVAGLAFNLGLLGYFKYAGFLADMVARFGGPFMDVGEIVLPLAISFYTFQQISFLVDTWSGKSPRYGFVQYASYLAFFPHLIAGPIVRHNTLIGQLNDKAILRPRVDNLLSGSAIIMIGLFKKVVLADGAAVYVNPIFFAAGNGGQIGFAEGWVAAVLFSFVIYFDFSGYSDIAIGLARLFNVRFPENFASPYKAVNIIDFWRRWHITLSSFLRDYLYVPLGGNRKGPGRRHFNLMLTMLLGGLWHGAALNFVIWGGLHGAFLVIAHAWHNYNARRGVSHESAASRIAARMLTYFVVVVAWVFFRTSTMDQAMAMFTGMSGINGMSTHIDLPGHFLSDPLAEAMILCALLLVLVNFSPNTQQYMRLFRPVTRAVRERIGGVAAMLVWRPGFAGVCFVAILGVCAILNLDRVQSFIYFRF